MYRMCFQEIQDVGAQNSAMKTVTTGLVTRLVIATVVAILVTTDRSVMGRCSDNCTGGYTQCDDVIGQCTEGCSNRAYGVLCNTPCARNCRLCTTSPRCKVCDDGYYGPWCLKCQDSCVKCTGWNDCALCVDGFSWQ